VLRKSHAVMLRCAVKDRLHLLVPERSKVLFPIHFNVSSLLSEAYHHVM